MVFRGHQWRRSLSGSGGGLWGGSAAGLIGEAVPLRLCEEADRPVAVRYSGGSGGGGSDSGGAALRWGRWLFRRLCGGGSYAGGVAPVAEAVFLGGGSSGGAWLIGWSGSVGAAPLAVVRRRRGSSGAALPEAGGSTVE